MSRVGKSNLFLVIFRLPETISQEGAESFAETISNALSTDSFAIGPGCKVIACGTLPKKISIDKDDNVVLEMPDAKQE